MILEVEGKLLLLESDDSRFVSRINRSEDKPDMATGVCGA